MAVKKVFVELFEFLEDKAKDPKITLASVMEEAQSMCEAQRSRGGQTFIRDAKKNVVGILDYTFKRWMPLVGPKAVEFGSKVSSSTGLNPSCKEGASIWTKNNRLREKELKGILGEVKSGKLDIKDIDKREAAIKAKYSKVPETDLGFETKDELVKYLTKVHKVKLIDIKEA